MSLLRKTKIKNGDFLEDYYIFRCDSCGCSIYEEFPHVHTNNRKTHYCLDCSYKKEHITENDYLKLSGITTENASATIQDGKIIIWIGRKAPWEKNEQDERNTPKYKKWRNEVFKRDDYTCQSCGQKGGTLNAHHIKHFSTNKELRFELSNGLTLCVKCHRDVHKKDRCY